MFQVMLSITSLYILWSTYLQNNDGFTKGLCPSVYELRIRTLEGN